MKLRERVAIVTGGNSGIGRAIVLNLAQAGAAVAINYITHPEAADALVAQIQAAGGQAVALHGDVSKVADLQALVDQTVQTFGRLDIMVNNAGVETRTSVLESTEHDFDVTLAVNLKGAFFGTQIAAKQFIAQGSGGRIINISSVHEDWPMPGNTPYCCTKGGIRMLTRTAGVELAPHNITVVNVAPGAVATPINQATLSDADKTKVLDEAIPLGRVAQPEEVAELVSWLAADSGRYVTATTYFIDGGIMQNSVGL